MERIVIWCPYMGNVGTIRASLNLAKGLVDLGLQVDLLKIYREWEEHDGFLQANRIDSTDFGASKVFRRLPKYGIGYRISMGILSLYSLPRLISYIRKEKPDAMVVCLLGFVPFLAARLAGRPVKMILSVQGKPHFNVFRKWLWNRFQSRADKVVVLTESTRSLVLSNTSMDSARLSVINNPVIYGDILEKSQEPLGADWPSEGGCPVVLGVGRLSRQKDYKTLLRAFALVRSKRPCKLALLGDGEERRELALLAQQLGIEADVHMPGFVKNPFKYMANSHVFVLSSLWEDNPHVLLEAAYLGIPIVSTDCPSGPAEFLERGRLGGLCPVGDAGAMAEAILSKLDKGRDDLGAIDGARAKSLLFTIEKSASRYYELIHEKD